MGSSHHAKNFLWGDKILFIDLSVAPCLGCNIVSTLILIWPSLTSQVSNVLFILKLFTFIFISTGYLSYATMEWGEGKGKNLLSPAFSHWRLLVSLKEKEKSFHLESFLGRSLINIQPSSSILPHRWAVHVANGTTDICMCVQFSLRFSIFKKPNKSKCQGVSSVESSVLKR